MDDHGLLREYVRSRSEPAFSTLVDRHLRMVYCVACRIVGDAHLAQDVAQNVFTTLASKADGIGRKRAVAGWLWHTTRHLALHAVRTEQRRRARELAAVTMQTPDDPAAEARALAQLESAMAQLDAADHEALVLRHLENRSLRDVGRELGITEDAARMRVNRALEKLRGIYGKQGITVSATLLLTVLAGSTAKAVPLGLAMIITSTAIAAAKVGLLTGGAAATSKWFTVKTVAAMIVALGVTAAVVEFEVKHPVARQVPAMGTPADLSGGETVQANPAREPDQTGVAIVPVKALVNAPSEPAPEVQALLKRAITLIAGKHYADARGLLDEAIGLKPDFADAFFYRGNTYAGLGQVVRAMADYSHTIELNPAMPLAWFQRSTLHEQLKEYNDAIRDGNQAISLAPEFWGAYLVRGRSYYAQDMQTEARRDFERVLELSPDCEEARVLLAAMPITVPDGLAAGTLDDALADLDHTITLAPNRADYHTKRGLVLLAMKRPQDAMTEFNKSLALMPDKNYDARFHRGQAWFALGQPRSAISLYSGILSEKPGWLPALTERGLVRLSLGEFEQARKDYEQALRSGDHSVNSVLMAALCAIQLHEDDHALETLRQAEKNNPAGPDRFELRGLTYASLERWSAANADYTQALEHRPGLGRLYYYRCVGEARLNQLDEALADALKGLAAKEVEPQVKLQLTLLAQGWLREQGRFDEARNWLKKLKIEPADAWPSSVVRFLRGELTWTQLQLAAVNDEQRSEAYAYAGWLDLLEGRPGTGREKLQWVIDHADKKVLEYELARRLLALEING